MTTKETKNIQIISVLISALSTIFCLTAFFKPELLAFPNTATRLVPTAAIVNSVGSLAIGVLYLIILTKKSSTAHSKWISVALVLLLCAFSVIVEPVLHIEDAKRFALTGQNIEGKDVDEIRALTDAVMVRNAIREVVVLIMFVSKALMFFSLGGFWKTRSKQPGTVA